MNDIPFNEEFERAVIVGTLQDPLILPKIITVVSSNDFFKEVHREIFHVIENSETIDSITIKDALKPDTKEYFQKLVDNSDRLLPNISNIFYYAEEIRGKSRLRSGIELGRQIATLCYEEASSEEAMHKLEEMFSSFLLKQVVSDYITSTKEAFQEFGKDIYSRLHKKVLGIESGFQAIDLMINRLEDLVILAARPGMGKTALAINIARNVAATKPVLFFSLEQSREQIFERILAAEAEVDHEDIRTGAFIGDPRNKEKVERAQEALLEVFERIHVDDRPGVNAAYIASVARQKKYEWGEVGLIIIDYLHIMRLNDKLNTVEGLGEASKELRNLGKELGCPVLLLAQLSRQNENRETNNKPNKRPQLSDLRASGEIEQTADIVMFLYRDSYYNLAGMGPEDDSMEIIVQKHRNGRTGIATLRWLPRFVKFKDF
jgi:replicative DNA helicase